MTSAPNDNIGTSDLCQLNDTSGKLHAVISGGIHLKKRALPGLEDINRSVRKITKRWPDAVTKPDEQDRQKLALEISRRVDDWDWSNLTTQRILSAAVALFDKHRCNEEQFLEAREFYYTEIAASTSGVFLDGMFQVYVDSFGEKQQHSKLLAQALRLRQNDLGQKSKDLVRTLPTLFDPKSVLLDLSQIMVSAQEPYDRLKEIGFRRPHESGLTQEAQNLFIQEIKSDLANSYERQQLENWLVPLSGTVLQSGAAVAVEALIAPWKTKVPPDVLREELSEFIISAYGDPRLHSGGIWAGFDSELKGVLLKWLTHQDMKFFCDMVTATQDSNMWGPRRDFWLKLYDQGMIDEAWVAFGSQAKRYAKEHLIRDGRTDLSRRFGEQLDRGGSTSLLIMRIGKKIVIDGCHSYKTHIFKIDDERAPKLYQRKYYCDKIMRSSRNSKAHNSIRNWSRWVMQHV